MRCGGIVFVKNLKIKEEMKDIQPLVIISILVF